MTTPPDKKFRVATCQHCGKSTNIDLSKDVQKMLVIIKSQKEELRVLNKGVSKLRRSKNGQIQAMHKSIAQLWGLLTPTQKNQAFKISSQLRDEIKRIAKLEL